ncbi:MAG: glycogen phosphorylase, partial [Acidimicrobiaceae bacterium]
DDVRRDELEANSLFEILERQVMPLFYERQEGPVPRRWVHRMKAALRSLGPEVTAARMVRDYVEQLYEPTAFQTERIDGEQLTGARELATWKQRVLAAWGDVAVLSVETDVSVASLGADRTVDAEVQLGSLTAADVEVQLVHGPVGQSNEIANATVVTMHPVTDAGGTMRYRGAFTCGQAGRYGFTVRVVPCHPLLVTPVELGRIAWA